MFQFFIDGTADAAPSWLAENPDVTVIPTPVHFGATERLDLSPDEFYALQQSNPTAPITTSNPTGEQVYHALKAALEEGKDVAYLVMAHSLSEASYLTAHNTIDILKAEYTNRHIFAVDTDCMSGGIALLLDRVKREAGPSIHSIIETVNRYRPKVSHLFSLTDLTQVSRSGRFNHLDRIKYGAAALVGIKVLITFDYDEDDHYGRKLMPFTSRLYRNEEKLFGAMTAEVAAIAAEKDGTFIVAHGNAPERAAIAERMLRAELPDATILSGDWRIGPAVGAHVGPSCVSIYSLRR